MADREKVEKAATFAMQSKGQKRKAQELEKTTKTTHTPSLKKIQKQENPAPVEEPQAPKPSEESDATTVVNGTEKEEEETTFEALGVIPELCESCKLLGWTKPTNIQRESIPIALSGTDPQMIFHGS